MAFILAKHVTGCTYDLNGYYSYVNDLYVYVMRNVIVAIIASIILVACVFVCIWMYGAVKSGQTAIINSNYTQFEDPDSLNFIINAD